jgi:hypothetical protein
VFGDGVVALTEALRAVLVQELQITSNSHPADRGQGEPIAGVNALASADARADELAPAQDIVSLQRKQLPAERICTAADLQSASSAGGVAKGVVGAARPDGLHGMQGHSVSLQAQQARRVVTGGGFHPAESLVYIGGPTALCLLLLSLVFEQPAVLTTGLALVLAKPGLYFAAFSAALLANMTGFWAIQVRCSVPCSLCCVI